MKSLSKDAIRRVREAEAEAATIRAEAEREAAVRIQNAEKQSVLDADATIAATDATLREELERVKVKADELIEESRREAEDDVTALETAAREHMREAVKLIVWEMYDECQ